MEFVKESANRQPIVDTVFSIVAKAKADKEQNGPDNVVDATIGSLYDEEGKLVALDTVFSSLKDVDNRDFAKYAASFTGNPDFRERVYEWVLDGHSHLANEVIATPGGTGAVGMTLANTLEAGETVVLPSIAWGSYNLMAQMNNYNVENYDLFDGDAFNIESLKAACNKVIAKQHRLVLILNDPCHNPTGYSMSDAEWDAVIAYLNDVSKEHPVVLLNDIAYIDFSFRGKDAKKYFAKFDAISENVAVVVAFSLSKSMTSYGLRCGAAILLAQEQKTVEMMKIVFEKAARATWSNINNSAMVMFVDVLDNHLDAYNAERQKYVDLLKERCDIFTREADAVGLTYYPFREGFFVTLSMDNATRDAFHEKLMENHIYTVKVNQGIRVATCSLSVEKTKGLAKKMKDILDTL